jgi:hypothetical protein
LGAAAAMIVPGFGPVLAAGILYTAMGAAAAGAATGGLLGAMSGLGASEEEARFYEKEFDSGKAIVTVKPGGDPQRAMEILRRHGGYDIKNRDRLPLDESTSDARGASERLR